MMWPYIIIGMVLLMLGTASKAMAYVGGMPAEIDLVSLSAPNQFFFMRRDAAEAFRRMADHAARDGMVLRVTSGFRSMVEQERLYALYKQGEGNLAARPGFSNHQSGIAVDIETGGFGSRTYQWLANNARAYGYVNTGASFSQKEPWHWEFQKGIG